MKKSRISNAVIRRLPRYYRKMTELMDEGVNRISSVALGESMKLTASQIRQDLACFGEFGQQGYGYNVEHLRSEIGRILGIEREHSAVIIGLGNLGRALLQNFHFERSGIEVKAVFETAESLIGQTICGVKVYSVDQMDDYLSACPTDIAVLTVPQSVAEDTARRLARGGVRGIWNFTNIELNLSEEQVIVENVHFADSLLSLNYMITELENANR